MRPGDAMESYHIRYLGAGLMLGLLAMAGCDQPPPTAHEPTDEGLHVVLDLTPLFRQTVDGVQQECVAVVDQVLLTVTSDDGTQTLPAQPVTAETPQVDFDSVMVQQGAVTFQAEVRSNAGTVLYAAEQTTTVDAETFTVTLDLEKQAPVLQVCPLSISLTQNTDYTGTFSITNRGTGVLTWAAEELGPGCDGQACLELHEAGGEIPEGETVVLRVEAAVVDTVGGIPIRIASPEGDVEVVAQVDIPPNQPPTITSDPVTAAEVDQAYRYEITAVDPEGDALTFPAPELPAWLRFEDQGGGVAELTGTPAVTDAGAYDLVLTVQDARGATDEQPFTLMVEDNVSPLARADTVTTDEDEPITIEPLLNDTDPQGRFLQVLAVTRPLVGGVEHDGQFLFYDPAPNYAGDDIFSYVVGNPPGYTDTAAVRVTVNPSIDDFVTLEDGRRYTLEDADADGRIYTEHTVPVYLSDYQSDETVPPDVIWTISAIELGVDGFGAGQTLIVERSTLDIRFEKRTAFDDRPVRYVSVDLYDRPTDDADVVNFSVNDEPLYVATSLTDKAPVPAGMRLIVQPITRDGSARRAVLLAEPGVEIRALRIGGYRLVLDNVRFGERQP